MTTASSPPRPSGRSFGQWLRDMPRWKKVAVALGVLTAIAGAVLMVTQAGGAGAGGGGGARSTSGLSTSLIDGKPSSGGASASDGAEPTAKGVFRLGFSFIAGFCLGSFLRATLRVAAIAFGFWLLMTLTLSYYDILTVDWTRLDTLWNRFAANVETEWSSFQTFVTGSLPAAGLVVTGFAIGLKRH